MARREIKTSASHFVYLLRLSNGGFYEVHFVQSRGRNLQQVSSPIDEIQLTAPNVASSSSSVGQ